MVHKLAAFAKLCLIPLYFTFNALSQVYTIGDIAGMDRLRDGQAASSAPLRNPTSVVVDPSGSVYIADADDNRIRKVSASGIITTVAGTGLPGYAGDRGPAANAALNSPAGLALDSSGNLLFADRGNFVVRRIAPDQTINTIAGTGLPGYTGDGGAALSARMQPVAVAVDSAGNIYVDDSANYRIRIINPQNNITTYAGTGQAGFGSALNQPATQTPIGITAGIAVDSRGNVYFSDLGNSIVWMVTPSGSMSTFAGSGLMGFINDGVPATMELMVPTGLALDAQGNLYICDINLSRVIQVNTSQIADTVVGNGLPGFSGDTGPAILASLLLPNSLAVDSSGNLYVDDEGNRRIRKVSAGFGTINTIAGTDQHDGGPAVNAFLDNPDGITSNGSGLFAVADSSNVEVREFMLGGNINGVGQVDGNPSGVVFDSAGNLYVSDDEPLVLKITPAGTTMIVAGNSMTGFGGDKGPATQASLDSPSGLALDAAGNLYIADFGNERIREVNAATQTITTFAGNGSVKASGDKGSALAAGLDPLDLAFDANGNLFVADFANNRVRKIAPGGIITTVAGTGAPGYTGDGGPAVNAQLNSPSGVAVDAAGNLYIADNTNEVVRRVNPAGLIWTIAGSGTASPESGDGGPALAAQMDPWKLFVDSKGIVYVSDFDNDRVRALTPQAATPGSLAIESGNNQNATAGSALANPLVVEVSDATGAALPGVTVEFAVSPASAATLSYPEAVSVGDGTASIGVTLGTASGPFSVTASAAGLTSVVFDVTAAAAISPTAPQINPSGVVSAGLSAPPVTSLSDNAIASVFGINFAAPGTAREAGPGDLVNGDLPTQLAGACITVGGSPAPIFSVFPNQINFQIPDVPAGNAAVIVSNQCGTPQQQDSSQQSITIQTASPEFFYFLQNTNGQNPIAAINAVTGAYIGAPGLIAGLTTVPAKSGDYLTLFATGFGPTSPSFGAGQLPNAAAQVTNSITVTVGGTVLDAAHVLYAGVTSDAGLYQLNIQLPANTPDGDQAIVVNIGGVTSPSGAFVTVAN
jgi:uncharacterized protein (TIGR03437 family)